MIGLLLAVTIQATDLSAAPAPRECVGVPGRILQSDRIDLPAVGDVHEVEIGRGMVSSQQLDLFETSLTFNAPTVARGRVMGQDYTVTIKPGGVRTIVDGVTRSFAPASYDFQYANDRSPREGWTKPKVTVESVYGGTGLIVIVHAGFTPQRIAVANADYAQNSCVVSGPTSFRRELIYAGVSQGTVSIDYREFTNDMARPAFSQTLRYDLSEGREIGFRGARFEIIEANNVSVKYRVIRPMSE